MNLRRNFVKVSRYVLRIILNFEIYWFGIKVNFKYFCQNTKVSYILQKDKPLTYTTYTKNFFFLQSENILQNIPYNKLQNTKFKRMKKNSSIAHILQYNCCNFLRRICFDTNLPDFNNKIWRFIKCAYKRFLYPFYWL